MIVDIPARYHLKAARLAVKMFSDDPNCANPSLGYFLDMFEHRKPMPEPRPPALIPTLTRLYGAKAWRQPDE